MEVINIERVESVMHLSPSVSVKEVLDLDKVHDPVLGGEPFSLCVSSYINDNYYRVVSADYYENLDEARKAMNDVIASWEKNPHRIILTNE